MPLAPSMAQIAKQILPLVKIDLLLIKSGNIFIKSCLMEEIAFNDKSWSGRGVARLTFLKHYRPGAFKRLTWPILRHWRDGHLHLYGGFQEEIC